jgi:uncharacterized Zn finger protein
MELLKNRTPWIISGVFSFPGGPRNQIVADESTELLRQMLSAQKEMLALQQQEAERTSEFRYNALQSQQAAQRRGMITLLILLSVVAFGFLIILLPRLSTP